MRRDQWTRGKGPGTTASAMTASADPQLVPRLKQHVDRLAGLIGPRTLSRPHTFTAAVGLIEQELTKAGYEITREHYVADGHDVVNVVAELRGTRRPDEIVILGAHYDTVEGSPGADDNASAVAVLLEVARQLRATRPRRTIRFVAFACEEQPYFHSHLMGSQVHARRCRNQGENVVAMLCLEMLGFFSSEPDSQRIPLSMPRWIRPWIPTRGDFLAAVGNLRSWRVAWKFRRGFKRATQLPLLTLALPESISEIRRSDNSSFWDQGYPALMITDTSFLRNPNYHLPSDTPDTLDYERMADAVAGVAGAVQALAGR